MAAINKPILEEASWLFHAAKAPRVRSLAEFAEQEIILPNGPYAGRRLKRWMQPATFVWFDEVDSGRWRRHVYVGPVQSGKTLGGLVAPLMHTLFERRETAILGAPKLEIAHDKWREDFLPVIKASRRYAPLLPTKGAGSRGGTPQDHIVFGNGVTLKFMSGQGSDDSRSAFTSRWVFVTETDKMDVAGEVSREADPVSQIEDRTMAFDRTGGGFIFLECTASVPTGKIWTEYEASSRGQLALPCPHCKEFVSPGREHFLGWDNAKTESEAIEGGHFYCPACGEEWSQEERIEANVGAVLVHDGQSVNAAGEVEGDLPKVRTLGFHASAVNNAFVSDATIAIQEWRKKQCDTENERDNLEKTLSQKVWALPWEPPDLDELRLGVEYLVRRSAPLRKGVVPNDTKWLTICVDIRKKEGHWMSLAWREDRSVHSPDYGIFDIASNDLGVERATLEALYRFRDVCEEGWRKADGSIIVPDAVWIDAGYKGAVVYQFCRESGSRYLPTLGRSATQHTQAYLGPKTTTKTVIELGDQYHIERSRTYHCFIVIVNADHWKTFTYQRLATPAGEPGAMTFFEPGGDQPLTKQRRKLAKHLTAERMTWQSVPGKGEVLRWVTESTENHWFDATYLACTAGHFCGFTITEPEPVIVAAAAAPEPEYSGILTPNGQPFVATER